MAIDGNTVVVGASVPTTVEEAAYVFRRMDDERFPRLVKERGLKCGVVAMLWVGKCLRHPR